MYQISQDKDSSLNYWFDFGAVVGDSLNLVSVDVDPDLTLPSGAPLLITAGINTSELTDDDGNTYRAGRMFGFTMSGGTVGERYSILMRATLDSGEQDDRTLVVDIVER